MILLDNKEIEFIPTSEIDSKKPVTFILKPMGSITKANFLDELQSLEIGNRVASFMFAQRMLVDIRNLGDDFIKEDGCEYIAHDLLDRMPEEVLAELAYKCAVIGGLVEEEKK